MKNLIKYTLHFLLLIFVLATVASSPIPAWFGEAGLWVATLFVFVSIINLMEKSHDH